MSSKPYFSVVLPTRNRADLLPSAIRSVLGQTFGDFEIIVSDNNSADETPQIASSFDDERIKYFRSETSLSAGDSFEFALNHARGQYVTFLSDDDAYAKIFLETFHRLTEKENAEIITCNLTPYYAVNTHNYGRNIQSQNLVMQPFCREIVVLNRAEAVNALFASIRLTKETERGNLVRFPQLVNSAYHHSIIQKVKERVRKIFPVLGSDIYSAALLLNVANRFCYIDEPLFLYRIWEGSETTGNQQSFRKYPEECKFDYVPLKKLFSSPNYITNVILRAKSDWGEDYLPLEFDWDDYFVTRYKEIKYMQGSGIDVSEELQEFNSVLAEQNSNLRKKIESLKFSSPIKNFLRINLKNTLVGKMMLKIKYPNVTTFDSQTNHFTNIEECAKMIDENFLKKHASPKEKCKNNNKWT